MGRGTANMKGKTKCVILCAVVIFIGFLSTVFSNELVKPNSITCQWRKELQVILCQRHHRGWFGIENTEFEFLDANVEEYTTTNGEDDYEAYRLFLNTDIGRIDVYDYDRDLDRDYADAAQFQAQLVKSGNPFLFFTYENDLLKNLILFFCRVCMVAIFLLFITGNTKWRIRKRCPFIRIRIKR